MDCSPGFAPGNGARECRDCVVRSEFVRLDRAVRPRDAWEAARRPPELVRVSHGPIHPNTRWAEWSGMVQGKGLFTWPAWPCFARQAWHSTRSIRRMSSEPRESFGPCVGSTSERLATRFHRRSEPGQTLSPPSARRPRSPPTASSSPARPSHHSCCGVLPARTRDGGQPRVPPAPGSGR